MTDISGHTYVTINIILLKACLLLSLEGVYPAAYQLALDMLRRLSTANDLIVEILINKQKIIPAMR